MVDRIGKKPPTPPTGGTSKVGETGRTFEVKKTEGVDPTAKPHEAQAVSASPIEQLRSGQITVDGYLDAKVNEATAHLEGLTPVQLDALRSMLRDQISTDPALADLFQQATGHAPPATDE